MIAFRGWGFLVSAGFLGVGAVVDVKGCLKETMQICRSFVIKLYEANSLMKQYGKKGSKEKGISI